MTPLLAADEATPVIHERPTAASPFLISCDHAGNLIPRSLGDLGVSQLDRTRHIAWDIGALGVARELAQLLDGELVAQRYSRLVIDCNRPPDSAELITTRSEATDIPGNRDLALAARALRISQIYTPYHDHLRALLDTRASSARATIFVAVHSFTPVYFGQTRPWQLGILSGADRRLANPMLEYLRLQSDLCVGDNEPYRIDDKDYGIPVHALARGVLHVLIEIRQDLIAQPASQRDWAQRLAEVLNAARAVLKI